MKKIHDINWRKVRSETTLAHELLKVAISLEQTPKNTHVINWLDIPANKRLLDETWRDWCKEFPDQLHDNLMRLSPRYVKQQRKNQNKAI